MPTSSIRVVRPAGASARTPIARLLRTVQGRVLAVLALLGALLLAALGREVPQVGAAGSTAATIPSSTTLDSGCRYLLANNGAGGYSGSVSRNLAYSQVLMMVVVSLCTMLLTFFLIWLV
jgi:hypothetical protein